MATHLKAGDPAPNFSGIATDGSRLALGDFHGRKLILYFYPMDDTPGCTQQACSLRDADAEILSRGAAIVGVSSQGLESHRQFSEKYGLKFPLIADTEQEIAKAYGAAGSGISGLLRGLIKANERITFIIDERGIITHVIADPNCKGHGAEVLSYL